MCVLSIKVPIQKNLETYLIILVCYLTPNLFWKNNPVYLKQFSLAWVDSLSKIFLFQAIQFSQIVLIQAIQFSIRTHFVYTQLNVKTVLY